MPGMTRTHGACEPTVAACAAAGQTAAASTRAGASARRRRVMTGTSGSVEGARTLPGSAGDALHRDRHAHGDRGRRRAVAALVVHLQRPLAGRRATDRDLRALDADLPAGSLRRPERDGPAQLAGPHVMGED